MPKLRTTDVYDRVAQSTGFQKRDVEKTIEALLELITNEIKGGTEVVFTGFGSFLAKPRKGRAGVNPKTMEKMAIPTVVVPKFKAGKNLKEALKETSSTPPATPPTM
ncbi:HU family DNA-binding protein [Candidatus Uhrbacteria bacterium]|nr:HU family DNA-binding protein [Candidatus Uhrbacteria bacterium]